MDDPRRPRGSCAGSMPDATGGSEPRMAGWEEAARSVRDLVERFGRPGERPNVHYPVAACAARDCGSSMPIRGRCRARTAAPSHSAGSTNASLGVAWLCRCMKAVLLRSGGRCENPRCTGDIQDVTDSGAPILEVDHVHDLAKGGPDNPVQMVALCPNCHAVKTRGRSRDKLQRDLLMVAEDRHLKLLQELESASPRPGAETP